MATTAGLHHVTAFAGPAARNLDFYGEVLGLRLVKVTVNFDDPGTYHLYYGDETGRPGTILTFFPIEQAAAGRLGTGRGERDRLPRAGRLARVLGGPPRRSRRATRAGRGGLRRTGAPLRRSQTA